MNLCDNQLTRLPESIGKFMNLKKLNLYGNRLADLPYSIDNLINLEKLDLRSNRRLTQLSHWISNILVNLQSLYLDEDQFI